MTRTVLVAGALAAGVLSACCTGTGAPAGYPFLALTRRAHRFRDGSCTRADLLERTG